MLDGSYSYSVVLFVFFKQKTAYERRISDWSSDVCSSDLPLRPKSRLPKKQPLRLRRPPPSRPKAEPFDRQARHSRRHHRRAWGDGRGPPEAVWGGGGNAQILWRLRCGGAHIDVEVGAPRPQSIGRETCRERGCQYELISGGMLSLKKKQKYKQH